MSSRLVGESRSRGSSALVTDRNQRSSRQTLDYDEMSITSDTEDDWSVLDENFDEIVHPISKNGCDAPDGFIRDESYVKTTGWLLVTANVDFEPSTCLNHEESPASPHFKPPKRLKVVRDCAVKSNSRSVYGDNSKGPEVHDESAKLQGLIKKGEEKGNQLKNFSIWPSLRWHRRLFKQKGL